jgi:hypothetical protein
MALYCANLSTLQDKAADVELVARQQENLF